jgi:hypothetical protein
VQGQMGMCWEARNYSVFGRELKSLLAKYVLGISAMSIEAFLELKAQQMIHSLADGHSPFSPIHLPNQRMRISAAACIAICGELEVVLRHSFTTMKKH